MDPVTPAGAKSQRDDMNLGPPRTPVAPLGLGATGFLTTMGSRPWLHPAVPSGLKTKSAYRFAAPEQRMPPGHFRSSVATKIGVTERLAFRLIG